jgi:hypothetical protein
MAEDDAQGAEQAAYRMEREEYGGTSFWVIFASVMIVLGSLSHVSSGATMVFNTTWVLNTTDYTSEADVQTLGWINLGIAALMLVSAWGVLSAKKWARAIGLIFGVLTVVNGISNLDLNVFWGLAGILVGAAIVFALTVKGDVVAQNQVLMGDQGAMLVPEAPGETLVEQQKDPDY